MPKPKAAPMKYQKRTYKRYKKKKTKYTGSSKGYLTNAIQTVAYQPDVMPRQMKTAFHYSTDGTFSTNAFSTVNSVGTFRLNTPQDPDYAIGGSSAQGWGIAQTYYGNYLVTGAIVKVIYSDPSADGIVVGVRFRQNSNNTPAGETLTNLQNTQMTYLKHLNNTGSQVCSFKYYIKPWVLTAKDYLYYKNDDNAQAVTTTIPANDNCLMDIFAINQNASAQTVNFRIMITYITKLWNRVAI